MRYRRLGRTDWMVSEVGLALRALEGIDEAAAGATLGAALAQGVTLVVVDAREHEGGVESLIGRVTTSERPRLVVLARFERLADASTFEAQLLAAGQRVSDLGYLDVALFAQMPDAGQRAVLDVLAATRTVRAWGIETADASIAAQAFEVGANVLVAPADASEGLLAAAVAAGVGVIIEGDSTSIGGALADVRVASVMVEAMGAAEVGALATAART
jgi:aryl-alcohol dehydrogenase-like predicted oxidoreductase